MRNKCPSMILIICVSCKKQKARGNLIEILTVPTLSHYGNVSTNPNDNEDKLWSIIYKVVRNFFLPSTFFFSSDSIAHFCTILYNAQKINKLLLIQFETLRSLIDNLIRANMALYIKNANRGDQCALVIRVIKTTRNLSQRTRST